MSSKSLGLLTVLIVVACNAVASAAEPVKGKCTFETLKDGRTMIVCPKAPVIKVER